MNNNIDAKKILFSLPVEVGKDRLDVFVSHSKYPFLYLLVG